MPINLRATYRTSDEFSRFATIILFGVILAAIVTTIFLSPTLVFALLIGVASLVVTFMRPTYSLAFLLLYLPLEPFILKWIPDDIYVFARFFSETLIYLLAAAVIWKLISRAERYKVTRADLPFILFVLMIIVSAVLNFIQPLQASIGARQILRFMLLFFITVQLAPSKIWLRNLFIGLFAILALQITLGYAQTLFGESIDGFLLPSEARTYGEIQITSGTVQFWDPGKRVFGTLGRYDRLGTFMAILMLMLVALLYEPKFKEYHRPILVLLLAAMPVLIFSYSRSAWFGFLLGFFFIALYMKRDRRVLFATSLAVGAIGIYLLGTGLVVNRLIDTPEQGITERFFETFSVARWRGEYYGLGRVFWIVQTVAVVTPASPLFGHGPGTYGGGAVAALGNTKVYDELGLPFGVYGTEGYIDNSWFSIWGETGTLGIIFFLWIYLTIFFACIRLYHKSSSPETQTFALAVASMMIAMALNSFLATFFEVRTLAPYIWVFGGMVIVLANEEEINL
jgi:hypothetical protein